MDALDMYDNSYFIGKDELNEQYQKILQEEMETEKQLETLYSEREDLDNKLIDLSVAMSNIRVIESDAKELANMVKEASEIVSNINSKMKKIDIGINNVSLCQKRVHDLLDLQLCSEGVQNALQTDDFETAAGHIHRFLSMDQQLLKQAANDMARDCEAVTNSVKLLHDATTMLQNKISLHFKEAVGVKDTSSAERFFKLFSLVGMKDYGLQHYCSFLCGRLGDIKKERLNNELKSGLSGKRGNVIFSDILTLLFEEIARIIESNQPLIETYCGSGNMLTAFELLQKECDIHTKQLLNEFFKVRQVDKISQTINDYSRNVNSTKMERIDAKSIDILLDEITIIHSRYQLYRKFIKKKIMVDLNATNTACEEQYSKFELFFNNSVTCQLMQELICQYLILEKYYMEENTKKALIADALEEDSQVTSLVDDIFFILRKCIRRSYLSGNIDAVCAVINNACTTLETEVCNSIKKKLKQGYSYGYLDLTQAYNVMMQGRLQQTDSDNIRQFFLAYLNNTEICNKFTNMLCETLREEIQCSSSNEKDKLDSCISSLNAVTAVFTSLNEYGLQQLQITVVKSRVVPWIDSFSTFNHQLTAEEFSSYEADEPFIRKLIRDLENLLSEFKPRLTSSNYDAFISIIVSEVAIQLEKVILKTEFSRMGGLALDKEIRTLVSYLSNATSWSVRDKFTRLIQIATVLNLEQVTEITEYWNANSSALTWKLAPKDIRQILSLRKDFRAEDIKRIKF